MQDDESKLCALVGAIGAGDSSSVRELYEKTSPLVMAVATRMLRDRPDVEEVLHDVYVQVWQRAKDYDASRGSVRAWLVMICRTRALDRIRKNRGRTVAYPTFPIESFEGASLDRNPESLLSAEQHASKLASAMESLSPLRRTLLSLAYFDDMSHAEIALVSDLPLGTVKSHIRRALSELLCRTDLSGGFWLV